MSWSGQWWGLFINDKCKGDWPLAGDALREAEFYVNEHGTDNIKSIEVRLLADDDDDESGVEAHGTG